MLDPAFSVRKLYEDSTLFHELMSFKVREILLVSSPYDAFALEEDGSLAQRIINEYHGLNLSAPPRLNHVATVAEALQQLTKRKFDLVLCMPYVGEHDAFSVGRQIKKIRPRLPVVVLTPNLHCLESARLKDDSGVDRIYIWAGDSRLLLALIKNLEDHVNVRADTKTANVRVLVLVEDSPEYVSSFLPLLYRVVVRQTQSVLKERFTDENRLLKMRARPKILLASSYEQATALIKRYEQYVFCVMSDTRFPRNGGIDENAGVRLLQYVRKKASDMPLLLMSSDPGNRTKAEQVPAVFVDKNNLDLLKTVENFFIDHLGFGDFVFRMPAGEEVARAKNIKEFETLVSAIPEESFLYHAQHQHFSNWIRARSEIGMAKVLSVIHRDDFATVAEMRKFLAETLFALRKYRHQGVVADFDGNDFEPNVVEIVKMGEGSMGGKARGIAFLSSLLCSRQDIHQKFTEYSIKVPKTLIIASEAFNEFVENNTLYYLCGGRDHIISRRFLKAALPDWLRDSLRIFLEKVDWPLAVRSSSMYEDARYRPYAGLYKTVMLPNNHPNFAERFGQLQDAVKFVYASTYFENPRSYARGIGQSRHDSMSVIIQQLIGQQCGDFFYPAISGVAQSYNYYPVSYMKPDDGIVSMALGFGKTVVEGEKCFRFCPKFPQILPQFSSVDETLENSQRYFYGLNMACGKTADFFKKDNLVRLEIAEAEHGHAINTLCSTYIGEEHRIRESGTGPKVVTFSQVLRHKRFPLPEIITEMLEICENGMGCPVEIEFAVDLCEGLRQDIFYLLQIRPLIIGAEKEEVILTEDEVNSALCYSEHTLGHGIDTAIEDLVIIKRAGFSPSKTRLIVNEISKMNASLAARGKRYILAGPGRWGSADPLLGIPVEWRDISSVAAIIELVNDQLKVEPSQGTHFFQNITSLNIFYLTVRPGKTLERFDWEKVAGLSIIKEDAHVLHVRAEKHFYIKVDGNCSRGVISVK